MANIGNKYLISSKTFTPLDFLRDVHTYSSAEDLRSGLQFLSTSINQKSSALKLLVSNNFDRFVLAKSTIDAVYREMKLGSGSSVNLASSSEADGEGNADRSGSAFRLIKEDEWGLKSLRLPLTEARAKADVVFGPMLENQGREERLRVLLRTLEKY